ncbi:MULTISPECIES: hypothetical protein [unclassified Paracoccus (in: a-proteobacteria)]|uniref:hypothetical protein n=1 Tax=unclassified Paracoccus (in: a-proteobacteria) TaxID=2688777 RepID=UPI0012EDC66B|nr:MULTISPECIES: hypothetical protein [unclassified Paracoccus (in: a-proteobacteria)]MCO6363707.1 hypothetical protein [Paracoccus sp. 08]
MNSKRITGVDNASEYMPIKMSVTLYNPVSDEQGIEYIQMLRAIENVNVWRRPNKLQDRSILYHEIFVKCWPDAAASVAEVLASIASNHPANKEIFKN